MWRGADAIKDVAKEGILPGLDLPMSGWQQRGGRQGRMAFGNKEMNDKQMQQHLGSGECELQRKTNLASNKHKACCRLVGFPRGISLVTEPCISDPVKHTSTFLSLWW